MNIKPASGNRGKKKHSKISKRTRVLLQILFGLVGIIVVFVVYLAATGQLNKNADSLGGNLLSLVAGTSGPTSARSSVDTTLYQLAVSNKGAPTCNYYSDDPTRACAVTVSNWLQQLGVIHSSYPSAQDLLNNLVNYAGYQVIFHSSSRPTAAQLNKLPPGGIVFFLYGDGVAHHVEVTGQDGWSVGASSSQQLITAKPMMNQFTFPGSNFQGITVISHK